MDNPLQTMYPRMHALKERARERLRSDADKREDLLALKAETAKAIASEVLPRILGGDWVVARKAVDRLMPRTWMFSSAASNLFDHPMQFCRKGRGALRWPDAVLAGEPYIPGLSTGSARAFAEDCGIGMWSSRGLSTWFPDFTMLVLAARGLPADPEPYGFELVAPEIPMELPDRPLTPYEKTILAQNGHGALQRHLAEQAHLRKPRAA